MLTRDWLDRDAYEAKFGETDYWLTLEQMEAFHLVLDTVLKAEDQKGFFYAAQFMNVSAVHLMSSVLGDFSAPVSELREQQEVEVGPGPNAHEEAQGVDASQPAATAL